MSFFDKIKKIFGENKKNIEEAKREAISINDIPKKFLDFVEEYNKKDKAILSDLSSKIKKFSGDIEESVAILELVDLSKRKEQENLKSLVLENLNLYIKNLKRLASTMNNINETNSQETIKKIFSVVTEFKKRSHLPYEKATILIGKEMAKTKELIKSFSSEIESIAENNNSFFNFSIQIQKMNYYLESLEKNKQSHIELDEKIKILESSLNENEEQRRKIENEIEKIKESKEYEIDSAKKESIKNKEIELENKLKEIKNKINFKALKRAFHHDEKKNQLIKNYSDNFKSALKEDENLLIIEIVRDSQNIDVEILKEIQGWILNSNSNTTETDRKIANLQKEIEIINSKSISLQYNIEQEIKKKQKADEKRSELITEIKSISSDLFPNLEVI